MARQEGVILFPHTPTQADGGDLNFGKPHEVRDNPVAFAKVTEAIGGTAYAGASLDRLLGNPARQGRIMKISGDPFMKQLIGIGAQR